ncbi:MAG: phosphopantetheine-binding protein [Candidatus Binatia bacterium]
MTILQDLLSRRDEPPQEVNPESALYTEGLNLDSLEVAEFSAVLEQEFGRDPFTDGELPKTLGDVLRYYGG